jgi:hypothetical protein
MQLDSAKKRVSGKRTNDRTITTFTFDFHGCIHARVYLQPAWTRSIREICSMVIYQRTKGKRLNTEILRLRSPQRPGANWNFPGPGWPARWPRPPPAPEAAGPYRQAAVMVKVPPGPRPVSPRPTVGPAVPGCRRGPERLRFKCSSDS